MDESVDRLQTFDFFFFFFSKKKCCCCCCCMPPLCINMLGVNGKVFGDFCMISWNLKWRK